MTEQEKQELKQEILTAIKGESQSVTELEEVASLDGVNTLPAMRGTELVIAPVSLLGQPAVAAATQALAAKAQAEAAAGTAKGHRQETGGCQKRRSGCQEPGTGTGISKYRYYQFRRITIFYKLNGN